MICILTETHLGDLYGGLEILDLEHSTAPSIICDDIEFSSMDYFPIDP